MVCKHWNWESNFCELKEITINLDDLDDCEQTCPDYSPRERSKTVQCDSCATELDLQECKKVEIKNREYVKCFVCGTVVHLKRDDENLTDGIRD